MLMMTILLIVAQNDAHMRVASEMAIVRIHDGTVVGKANVHLFELLAEQGQ